MGQGVNIVTSLLLYGLKKLLKRKPTKDLKEYLTPTKGEEVLNTESVQPGNCSTMSNCSLG